MRDAVLDVPVGHGGIELADRDGALDLRRVAPDPLAPIVQDAALAPGGIGIAETIPDIGVLGDEAQRHLLAATTDEDGQLAAAHRGWIQLAEPFSDDRQGRTELLQPAGSGAEF